MYYTDKSTAASQSLAAGQKRGASSVLQYDHDCQEFPYNTMLEPVPQGKSTIGFSFCSATVHCLHRVVEHATQHSMMMVFASKVEQKTLATPY